MDGLVSNGDDLEESVKELMKKIDKEENLTKEQQRELIEQALNIAETSDDYKSIATNVCHDKVLADKKWGRKLFEKAMAKIDVDNGVSDLHNIALQIADPEQLNDKVWAKEIYEKAIREAKDCSDLINIANDIFDPDGIDDKPWGKIVIKKALELSSFSFEKIEIAQIIAHDDNLADKSWAKDIIKSLKEVDGEDCKAIAISYSHDKLLNDKKVGKLWFEKAIEAESHYGFDHYEIATYVYDKEILDDKDWATDLCLKSYRNVSRIQALIDMSILVFQTQKEQAKEIINYALNLIEQDNDYSSDDFFIIAAHISDNSTFNLPYFNDKEWGKKIFDLSIERAEAKEDKELIIDSMVQYL
jgi:hypothetical protein